MEIKEFKVLNENIEDYVVATGLVILENTNIAGFVKDFEGENKTFVFGSYSEEALQNGLTLTLQSIPFSVKLSNPKDIKQAAAELKAYHANELGYYADCCESEIELFYQGEKISTENYQNSL